MSFPVRAYVALAASCLLAGAALASQQEFHGAVYEKGSHRTKLLFRYHRLETREGDRLTVHARVMTPAGEDLVVEDILVEHDELKKYVQRQIPVDELGEVETRDGQIHFRFTQKGRTRSVVEPLPSTDFVMGSTAIHYLAREWPAFLAGKPLLMRLGIPDRQETVGFKFVLAGESQEEGRTVVRVALKPSHWLLALIVDPIFFRVDKATGRLLSTEGTTLLRHETWKGVDNLSAEMVFFDPS